MVTECNSGHKCDIWNSQEQYSLLKCVLMFWRNLLPPSSG